MESYFKLYLAIDYQYKDMIICQKLEQVEYELNKATGDIEVNRKGRIR